MLHNIYVFGFPPRITDLASRGGGPNPITMATITERQTALVMTALNVGGYIPFIGTITAIAREIFCFKMGIHHRITPLTAVGGIFRAALESIPGAGLLVLLPIDIIVTKVRRHLRSCLEHALTAVTTNPAQAIPHGFENNPLVQQRRIDAMRAIIGVDPSAFVPADLMANPDVHRAKAEALFAEGNRLTAACYDYSAPAPDLATLGIQHHRISTTHTQRYDRAKHAYEQALALGRWDAAYKLGRLCEKERAVILGKYLYIRIFAIMAPYPANDPILYLLLARKNNAIRDLKLAAEYRYPPAQALLRSAIDYLKRAAAENIPDAETLLTSMTEETSSNESSLSHISEKAQNKIETLLEEALDHYKQAAANGVAKAQLRAAQLYEPHPLQTDATEEDPSLKFYEQAANNGTVEAQLRAAELYTQRACGENATEEDTAKALHYYKLAADNDNVDAQICLGKIYEGDKDFASLTVPQDLNLAKEYFTKAATQNNIEAFLHLARLLEGDTTDPQNEKKAKLLNDLAMGIDG